MLTKYYSLKNKLGERFGIDLDYFSRAGFWGSLTLGIDSVIGFLFSIYLIRSLSSVDLGKWYFIVSMVGLLCLFALPGTINVSMKSILKGYISSFWRGFKLQFIGGIVASFALLLISTYFYLSGQNFWLSLSLIFYFPFIGAYMYNKYNYLKDHFSKNFYYFLITSVFYYGLSALVLYYFQSIILVILSYFYVQTIFNLIFYYKTLKHIKKNEKQLSKKDPYLIKNSLKNSLNSFIPIINPNLDRILIPLFLSLDSLAIFGVIMLFPNFIKGISQRLMTTLFFKKFNQVKNLKKVLIKSSILGVILLFISGVILYLIIPYIFGFVTGNKYMEYIKWTQILILFIPISVISIYLRNYFDFTIKIKKTFYIDIITFIGYYGLFIILILNFGLLGAIIAKVCQDFIRLLTSSIFVIKS